MWSPDGTSLFGLQAHQLWTIDIAAGTVVRASIDLPASTTAAMIRTDGQWFGARGGSGELFAFDSSTGGVHAYATPSSLGRLDSIAWPAACGMPSPGGAADIIRSVTVEPARVCAGESVRVTVTTAHPDGSSAGVEVSIQGKIGATQYVQALAGVGTRLLSILATTPDHYMDGARATYEVIACPGSPVLPIVFVRPNVYHQGFVDFQVSNAASLGAVMYHWTFGDGATETTAYPYVSHEYDLGAANRDRLYVEYDASLTVRDGAGGERTVPKTISIANSYAFAKRNGFLQPQVRYEPRAHLSGGLYRLEMSIENLEPDSLSFATREISFRPCDPDRDPISAGALAHVLTVPANSTASNALDLAFVPAEACGVDVLLEGSGPGGLPAYAAAYYTIRDNPIMTDEVTDPLLLDVLNRALADGLLGPSGALTDEDLQRLEQEQRIPPVIRSHGIAIAPHHPDPPGPVGDDCQPGDPRPEPGLVCQSTGHWTEDRAHIPNASRGDLALSAGCGIIGSLLRNVDPAQRFSHTGMMTRSFYEIANSNASMNRFPDYAEGGGDPTEGIQEDAMRFGWPGLITQTIGAAYGSESRPDPAGINYVLHTFNQNPAECGGDVALSFATVIKPPPSQRFLAADALRAAAIGWRDRALHTSHYRFFGYTKGAIGIDDAFNDGPDMSYATMCSSANWSALKGRVLRHALEGALEPADFVRGAQTDAETADGLYFYDAHERQTAGDFLYTTTYDDIFWRTGWLAVAWSDVADDVASQLANCFANDGCDPSFRDRDDWQNPSVGRTVSPDDLFNWDSPAAGGLYGYQEPLLVRPGTLRPAYAWAEISGSGRLRGRVLRSDGTPVGDATVIANGTEAISDVDGSFHFFGFPAGSVVLVARKLDQGDLSDPSDDVLLEGTAEATVLVGETADVEIIVDAPIPSRRFVQIRGSMFIFDHESVGANETETVTFFLAPQVSPDRPTATVSAEGCAGHEVRVVVSALVVLEPDDRTVRVTTTVRLFEGTDCRTDDLEASDSAISLVAQDAEESVAIHVLSPSGPAGTGGGDFTDVTLSISNLRSPI